MDNYFRNYVACLLSSGELPNLGATQDPNSACDDEFQPFTLMYGRPPVPELGGDTSTNSASTGSGGGGGASSQDSSSDGDASRGIEASGNDSGRIANFQQSVGSSGSGMRPASFRSNEAGVAEDANAEKSGRTVSTRQVRRSTTSSTSGIDTSEIGSGRPAYVSASRFEEDRARDLTGGVAGVENSESGALRKAMIEQEIRSPSQVEDQEEEGLSFGDFLRYLLITAIVIAIVLFLAGQLLQIQKSMEK